jgi:hypothetical protein
MSDLILAEDTMKRKLYAAKQEHFSFAAEVRAARGGIAAAKSPATMAA